VNGKESRGILLRNLNVLDPAWLQDLIQYQGKSHNNTSLLEKRSQLKTSLSSRITTTTTTTSTNNLCAQPDFVELESDDCSDVALVGGKGASLAALNKLSNEIQRSNHHIQVIHHKFLT